MLRLDDSTRGPSGPTAEPQEGGASGDDTLKRTGRSDILAALIVACIVISNSTRRTRLNVKTS